MTKPIRMGVLGIDHRHIYTQIAHMQDVGAELVGWWSEGNPETLPGFTRRFADAVRAKDRAELLEDSSIDLMLIASIPVDRAALAIEAMLHGKDVMTDKPGCTTRAQLDQLVETVKKTGRIWSVDFSERFETEASTKATDLVRQGAIGQVVQTLGLGPHRLNQATRPGWFFDRDQYGGILTDIASHQIDQFLHFTDSADASVSFSSLGNYANPDTSGLQDFGQIVLQSGSANGYVRVDWYTGDALPTWGDGRLFILGTTGTIELRKYVDIGGRAGGEHVFLVNGSRCEHIDATGAGLPYFANLARDIDERTETAMPQAHAFKVTELALIAQEMAEART